MIRCEWRSTTLMAWAVLALSAAVVAQDDKKEEKKEEPAGPKPKVSVIHLDNPSGIAIHPTTKHVFVTAHQGVFRFVPGKPGKIYLEVDSFSTDVYGKGPMYNIGPLGCTLWGNDKLIVADGSKKD